MSETFIQAQSKALSSFQPQYVGLRLAQRSLNVPEEAIVLSRATKRMARASELLFKFAGFGPWFRRQVVQAKPSLIHAHFALDGVAALPLARDTGAPLIVTLHGYDVTTRDTEFRKSIGGNRYLRRRSELWQLTSTFLCVSEFIKRKAIECGFPHDKLQVHHIGIDRTVFAYDGPRERAQRVIFVGRLVEKKGCEYLIRALELVKDTCPEVELIVIGDGPLRQTLENLARDLRVKVRFLGLQDANAVRDWLESSKICCVPSVTAASGDSEGLPMVLAEAQAVGTPVVSTLHAGIPEMILHGETGLLAEERDHITLGRHMTSLLQDAALWQRCSTRAVEWMAQEFDLFTQTRKLERIYAAAIEKLALCANTADSCDVNRSLRRDVNTSK